MISKKINLFVAALFPLFFFAFLNVTEAAVRTWDGGGANNYWSNAANWSDNTLPTSADDVVFNGTSVKNSTIDAAFAGTVGSVSVNAGYTGTITTSRVLTVTKSAGMSGNITIGAGTWNVGTQTIILEGNWLKTGGTFNPGSSGTVNFSGTSGTQTVDAGGQNFYNWHHTGASTVQVNSALSAANQFTNTAGIFNLNGQNLIVGGTSNLSGGTLNMSSGIVSMASTLTINGATFNGDSSNLTINTLSLSGGALVATSGTFNVNGNWVRTGGTFTPGLGTVNFTGVNQNLNSGNAPFNNVGHNGTGTLSMTGNLSVGGTLVNSAGDFNSNTRVLVVTGLASFDGGSYFSSTGSQTFNGGLNINGATWNGDSGLIVVAGNFNANSTVNAPSSFFTVSGDFILSPGVFLAGVSGTVRMDGAGAQSLQLNGNSLRNFYNIGSGTVTVSGSDVNVLGIFRNNSGSLDMNGNTLTVAGLATIDGGTYSPGVNVNNFNGGLTVSGGFFNGSTGPVNIVGDLNLTWGTFQASATTTTLSGSLMRSFGNFSANAGNFVLTGTGQSIIGDLTFNNLQKNVVVADTLTFGNANTLIVTGLTNFKGIAGNLLTLNTDLAAVQVNFDPQGGRAVEYLDVIDNNNINATAIECLVGCVDSGNNFNWEFPLIQFSSATGNVAEAGGSFDLPITLSHALLTPVTVDYTVNFTSTATGGGVDYTLADGTATFNAGTVLPATPVTVTVNDDWLDELAETIVVDLSGPTAPASLGTITNFVLTIIDNDVAGFDITLPGATTNEAGGTTTFDVRLTSEPTAPVTITVSSSDLTEGTVDVVSVTFDNTDWNVYKTVTVSGVDDDVADGNITYSVVLAPDLVTADVNYNGLNPADVSITNVDDDSPGFDISPPIGATSEPAGTQIILVRLTSEPLAPVTIGVASNDLTEGTADVVSLTFDNTDWNVFKPITVTGVDDFLDDGDVAYQIVLSADVVTLDPTYNGLDPADVAMTNTDDDVSGVLFGAIDVSLSESAVANSNQTIVLTAEPTAPVTVTATFDSVQLSNATPQVFVFDNLNWNVPQTIVIRALDDTKVEGLHLGFASFGAVSTDLSYSALLIPNQTYSITDNDYVQSGAGGQFVCPAYDASEFQINLLEQTEVGELTKLDFSFEVPRDVNMFAISTMSDFSDVSFKSYAPTVSVELSNVSSGQEVYFRFRNFNGCSQDRRFELGTSVQGFIDLNESDGVQAEEEMGEAVEEDTGGFDISKLLQDYVQTVEDLGGFDTSKVLQDYIRPAADKVTDTEGFDPSKVLQDYVQTEPVKAIVCPLFVGSLSYGSQDFEAVAAVQSFLFDHGFLTGEYAKGVFGDATLNAVKAFQAFYREEILWPWGIDKPTGYWHITSKRMANKLIGC